MLIGNTQPLPFEGFTFEIGEEGTIDGGMIYYGGTAMVAVSFPDEAPSKEWKVSLVKEIIEVLTSAYDEIPDYDWDEDGLTFTDYNSEEFEDVEAWAQSMAFLDSLNEEHL